MLKIMYLKINPFKSSLARLCFRTRQVLRREENQHEILEGRFRNLKFSTSTKKTTEYSFGLFLSDPFIDIRCFSQV